MGVGGVAGGCAATRGAPTSLSVAPSTAERPVRPPCAVRSIAPTTPTALTLAIAGDPGDARLGDTAWLAGPVLHALIGEACGGDPLPAAVSGGGGGGGGGGEPVAGGAPAASPSVIVRHVDDGRDAFDAGADLVVTRDPTTVAYVASRDGFSTVPLPWDRAYVLVVRATAPTAVRPDDSLATALRTDLALESVHAAAQPMAGSSEADTGGCPSTVATDVAVVAPDRPGLSRRIAYDQSDGVSRELAERLVALTMEKSPLVPAVAPELTEPGSVIRAGGLGRTALARAAEAGTEWAYVLAVPTRLLARCDPAAFALGDGRPIQLGTRIIPLIETRATVVVRQADLAPMIDALGALAAGAPNGTSP